ncbi:MAG: hypothetical protein V3W14_09270 [Candidatus Neomarinimicrobiota bacterium]
MVQRLLIFCIFGARIVLPDISMAAALGDHGTKGMATVVGQGQGQVYLPMWTSDKTAVIPSAGLRTLTNGWTEITLGIGARLYRPQTDKLYPYAGLAVGATASVYSWAEEFYFDYTGSVLLGGEYFLSHQFSVGIESQLNMDVITESTLWGRPHDGISLRLVSVAYLTLYFK